MKKDFLLVLDCPKPLFTEYNPTQNVFTIKDYYSARLFNEASYDYFLKDKYDFKEIFSTINTLTHKTFFKELSLNTPNSLNQVRSLGRLANHTGVLKLSTCLMRAGRKSQAIKLILIALFEAFNDVRAGLTKLNTATSFKTFYYLLSSSYMQSVLYKNSQTTQVMPFTLLSTLNISLVSESIVLGGELYKNEDLWPNNLYKSSIKNFNLLFSFYIHKVDKNIYKNSRGKSGKFTFVWKYIKPYKRKTLIAQWLMREVRVAPGKKLRDRLTFVMHKFIVTPSETMIWKINKFSQNYVYYHLRKSLGETCKTVMN